MAKLARRIVRITHSVEDLYTMFQWIAEAEVTRHDWRYWIARRPKGWTPNRSIRRVLRRSRARSERAAAGVHCPQCGAEPGAMCWDWFPGSLLVHPVERVCATHIARKWRAIDAAKEKRRIQYEFCTF